MCMKCLCAVCGQRIESLQSVCRLLVVCVCVCVCVHYI